MGSATDTRQRIFISYRRDETSGHAGRIYDAMVARFGEDNVFMDIDMAPGVDFVERITDVVSSCTVLIAVMGRTWAENPGPDGQPRLRDEADFVRLELGTAIRNPDVTVIPALVDKAQMPKAEQLPDEMRPLARRNALELSDGRWRYDVGRLNDTLEELLVGLTGLPTRPEPATPPPTPLPTPAAPPPPAPPAAAAVTPRTYALPDAARLVIEGILVAAVVAFLARWVADLIPTAPKPVEEHNIEDAVAAIARRTTVWALTGAALAVWLGARTRRTDIGRCLLLGLVVGAIAGAVGGAIYAIPVKLPDVNLEGATEENWDTLSLAVTGALLGALLGTLWRIPRLAAGLFTGLAAGAVIQALLNSGEWNRVKMPGVGFNFSVRAGFIVGAVLLVLLLLEQSRAAPPPAHDLEGRR
ncbi:MAG TPA: toll/interleukin-1 receptor domain-containing protein [Solirubrobacterales bacterium]|nr:toll/interleukin-1 receptor domain-containing protein [Solirubrobacterales bacterium]